VGDAAHNSIWFTHSNVVRFYQLHLPDSGQIPYPQGGYPTTTLLGQGYTDYTGFPGTSTPTSYGGGGLYVNPYGHPGSVIALSADGNSLWFTEDGADQIVKYDLSYRDPIVSVTTRNASGTATSTVNEGDKVYFEAAIDDGTAGLYAQWDFDGDGVYDANGDQRVVHKYAESGVYHVTLRVVNSLGQAATRTFDVTVNDVPPTVRLSSTHLGSPLPIDASGNWTVEYSSRSLPLAIQADATDISAADIHSGFTFTWTVTKDGSPYTSGSGTTNFIARNTFSFSPDGSGMYTVSVVFTDRDASTTASQTIHVAFLPAPPTGSVTQVSDIGPAYNKTPLTRVGSWLYFIGPGTDQDSLWRTNGRPDGTTRILDRSIAFDGNYPRLVAAGDYVYFFTVDGEDQYTLWRNDSRTGTSEPLQTVVASDEWLTPPGELTAVGQDVYFVANAPAAVTPDHQDWGYEIWRFNSATGVTAPFKDANADPDTGATNPIGTYPRLAAAGTHLYYEDFDGYNWGVTNPETGAAAPIRGPDGNQLRYAALSPATDYLYYGNFGGNLTVGSDLYSVGSSIWRITSPTAPAEHIADLSGDYGTESHGNAWTVAGSAIYFVDEYYLPEAGFQYRLWKCEGSTVTLLKSGLFATSSGTLRDFAYGLTSLAVVGSDIYYTGFRIFVGGGPDGVWKYDGTTGDVTLIAAFPLRSDPALICVAGSTLYFSDGNRGDGYSTIWQTDGTPAGTFPAPGSPPMVSIFGSEHVVYSAVIGSTTYFSLADGRGGGLWRVNNPPVATDFPATIDQDTPTALAVLAHVTDADTVDRPHLAASVVSGPAHGTLTLNADGSFTYTPAAGYAGTDSVTYRASDGIDPSNVATVAITVLPR
jgi:VCBS repeat-containing protein